MTLPDGVETERRARRRGLLGKYRTWRRQTSTMTKGQVQDAVSIIAILLAVAGWFVLGQFDAGKQRDLEIIRDAAELALYQQDVTAYNKAVADRALCIDSVGRSDANREAWAELADGVERLGGDTAVTFAEEIRTNPVLSSEPRRVEDCPPVPPVPVAPTP